MATNLDQVSNTPESKYEKIKKLLDKWGSLKDGIKDDKWNLQIFMEGDKIIWLNDVYDLKIIAKTIIGDIDTKVLDIVIIWDKVKISTDKWPWEISKNQFNTAIEWRIKTGSYISDINWNHIEFKKVATINRPNPSAIEAKKTGKKAEIMWSSESQRATLLEEAEKRWVKGLPKKEDFIKLDDNSIANIEKQAGTFWALWDKLSWIFDALMKWFDLILEWKFTEWFAAIMAGFTGKKEESKDNTENTQNNEQLNEIEKRWKDSFVSIFLTKTYKYKDKIQPETIKLIPSIIENPTIQSKKFNDLKNFTDINNKYYKNHNWIAKEVWMNYSDRWIFFAMHSITMKEKLIDELIWKENKDWRNLSIKDIFALIWPHLNKLSKLNQIDSLDDLDKINLWIIIKDWKIEWELSDSNFLLKNKDILTPALIIKIKWSLKDYNEKKDIDLLEGEYTKEQKDLLIGIINSWKWIQKDLSNSSNFEEFNLWLWNKFKDHFKNNPIKLSDSFDLILITWWKRLENLNSIEKSMFYIKLFKILRDKNSDLAWEYWSKIVKEIYNDWSNIIPKEVKDVIKTLSLSLSELATWVIKKEFEMLWWVAKDNPAASAAIIWAVTAALFVWWRVLATKALAWAIIIAALSAMQITWDILEAAKSETKS